MWNLWLKCKTYHKLPSELMKTADSLAAWMLDTAVTTFGIIIENALQERVKVTMGKDVQFKPRYTLARLLNPSYRLPKPEPLPEDNPDPWAAFKAFLGKPNSHVKRYKYVA